jgi:hypothetical protein
MRGATDDSPRNVLGFAFPYAAEIAILQQTYEPRLQGRAQLADFVQKERSVVDIFSMTSGPDALVLLWNGEQRLWS